MARGLHQLGLSAGCPSFEAASTRSIVLRKRGQNTFGIAPVFACGELLQTWHPCPLPRNNTQVHVHAWRMNFTTGNCSFVILFTVLRTLRSKPFFNVNVSNAMF